jgi:NAD(P)H-dependent flavin oxidoreductase YrpB (nitropropane dioxygenase family)
LFKGLQPIQYGGREVWPLIEGGKGVSATNHASSGAWAAAGGIGTVSAVNADSYDPEGRIIPQVYQGMTRRERHEELIQYGIDGAVAQVERAYEMADGKGLININVLWEMGGAQPILHGVLERTKGKIAGVTCGAGMPIRRPPNGWARWSTKIRGSPAATMACRTPRTRASHRIPIRASRSFAT